ncbi:hypothetical protein GOBAR_DD14356 [Gossypium barbadense]|nr:hypothetical protein GOBAR_DD14356 [Gossypium barbadense]
MEADVGQALVLQSTTLGVSTEIMVEHTSDLPDSTMVKFKQAEIQDGQLALLAQKGGARSMDLVFRETLNVLSLLETKDSSRSGSRLARKLGFNGFFEKFAMDIFAAMSVVTPRLVRGLHWMKWTKMHQGSYILNTYRATTYKQSYGGSSWSLSHKILGDSSACGGVRCATGGIVP